MTTISRRNNIIAEGEQGVQDPLVEGQQENQVEDIAEEGNILEEGKEEEDFSFKM